MSPFRRKRIAHPTGAGLTYCAGFDLHVSAQIPISVVIEIEQRRWGGTDIDPPRKLARHQLQASSEGITLRVSTDEGALGHPCAEFFRFTIQLGSGEAAEFEITETQGSHSARVISGQGWTAEYPEFVGPNGLRMKYRPLHGYLDR
jgi:hypothetical protein